MPSDSTVSSLAVQGGSVRATVTLSGNRSTLLSTAVRPLLIAIATLLLAPIRLRMGGHATVHAIPRAANAGGGCRGRGAPRSRVEIVRIGDGLVL